MQGKYQPLSLDMWEWKDVKIIGIMSLSEKVSAEDFEIKKEMPKLGINL